jgi:hypothetical protein
MAAQLETATGSNIEEIETKLLLEGEGVQTISAYQERLLNDEYLALGRRESLLFCPENSRYEQVRDRVNPFHKVR